MMQAIETYLHNNNFLKVDLPVMLPALIPESYLEVFETEYRYFDTRRSFYLAPSPELLLKRLLVDGVGNCYYLGKAFRNSEPESSKHRGEFTMLEMYKVGADYLQLADTVLEMLQALHVATRPKHTSSQMMRTYQGISFDLSKWEKLTVAEAFKRYAQIGAEELFDEEQFIASARKKGYQTVCTDSLGEHTYSYEDLWSQIYANEIEKNLGTAGHPTILYDYPIQFASLAKPNVDGTTAARFEMYIAGVELGNCYGELSDWKLQHDRLVKEQQKREVSGKIAHVPDWGFIDALKRGLPDCAGIAIGVERLGMIIADVASIADIRLIEID